MSIPIKKSALSFTAVTFREISSTAALMKLLLPIEIHTCGSLRPSGDAQTHNHRVILQNCVIPVSLLRGVWNSGAALAGVHRGAAIRFGKQYQVFKITYNSNISKLLY